MLFRRALFVSALLTAASTTFAADSVAGKAAFRQQCALCHSAQPNDDGGAQGPDLHNLIGRRAASSPAFSYTKALRDSKLTWNAATLDRFLASPTTVVPGSAMVVAVPKKEDRANLVAYFQAVKDGTFKDGPPRQFGQPPGPQTAAAPTKGDADWKKDAPGRVHRVQVADLPPPFDTPSARNVPKFIDKPADAKPALPEGFKLDVFASQLQGPRVLRLAPNGDVFVSETQTGRIKVLRPSADGTSAASTEVFAQGLSQPFGLAFYPNDGQPKWLYVGEINRVVRYAYNSGDVKASGVPEVVVPELSPTGGGHWTRDVVFSPDGKRMFVSIGSMSNVAEDMSRKSADEIKKWEAQHGLGAAWDKETNRATVMVFDVDSKKPGKIFATGIRNCVGLTMQPGTGDLWCTTNERDGLGDDLVPDYSTRVKEGGYYGWPWYYFGENEDPRLKGDRPDLKGKAIVPDVPYTAHSAALNLTFYTASSGKSAFPKEYVGEGFAVLHGSWNRAFRTGHKVVRVRLNNGVPTGEYQDFLTGFIADDGNAWARPVALTVMPDGAMLLSDDGANLIYRISYDGAAVAAAAAAAAQAEALWRGVSITGERVFPESLTSTKDGTVIVGSIGTRAIFRAAPGAKAAEPWIAPGTGGMAAIFGVLADEKSNTLWACSGTPGPPGPTPSPPSALYAFNLKTGAYKTHYPFPTAGGFCNDIAVGPDGTAYATDTSNMEVVRLKKGAKALEVWAGNGAFGPKGGVLDGIAVLNNHVIVNTLLTSKLFSIPVESRGKAGTVSEVVLDTPLQRPDGMRSFGKSSLLVVEGGGGGRLSRVAIDGVAGKLTLIKEGFPEGPVSVTVVGETAYVVEGQLGASRNPASVTKPFRATAVVVGKP